MRGYETIPGGIPQGLSSMQVKKQGDSRPCDVFLGWQILQTLAVIWHLALEHADTYMCPIYLQGIKQLCNLLSVLLTARVARCNCRCFRTVMCAGFSRGSRPTCECGWRTGLQKSTPVCMIGAECILIVAFHHGGTQP